ncbi:unnamed protein product [Diabrotica balteata]|uniref:Microsomal glutathione S-transferase 1 n=1 Tax=Diabrotica balteata TaxID=107213 RepID=A0A9N9XEC6_DIABA|nr:unnamed protein product [Diabrotica balteata]
MTIQSYISAKDNQYYEEFSEAISETERILIKSFKRIVIRSKRGRGVAVLGSKDVQEHLEMITKCKDLLLKIPRFYLFGNPKFDKQIRWYKVMSKFAKLCGAKNPSALTCTRLRIHLATLTQLFTISENDMEQLASFMGPTLEAFANPEDSKQMKIDPQVNENVERVRRAHLNDLENIPLFFVAGLIYTFANPGETAAKVLFVVYVVTRYLHTIVYAVVPIPQPARALCWSTGYIINIYMAMYSLIHFLKSSSV